MATTTPNYGWTVPTSTDLVKDGATAIETLGDSVDATLKALNPSTTLGDLEYRSATANTNTRLGIGTTGQVLTITGGVPVWASPAGGGKIAQVVQGSSAGFASITSTSFMDTGLSVTITPSLASSKIMIFSYATAGLDNTADQAAYLDAQFTRNGTSAFNASRVYGSKLSGGIFPNGGGIVGAFSLHYLDSPATTSAITYKLQMKVSTTTNTNAYFCNGGTAIMQAMEVLA